MIKNHKHRSVALTALTAFALALCSGCSEAVMAAMLWDMLDGVPL